MKVYIVPNYYPTPTCPLWANWMPAYVGALKAVGADPYLLQLGLDGEAGGDEWGRGAEFVSDSHVYVKVPKPLYGYQRTRFVYGSYLKKYERKLFELYAIAQKRWGAPDVIHAHVSLPAGYVAARLGNAKRVPVVVTEHYSGFESDGRFWWRTGCFVKEMVERVQGFYAVSPAYAERIGKTGLVPQIGILPNPVDTDLFNLRPAEHGRKYLQIVSTGNLGWIKGTDVLFEALRMISSRVDWRLTLFGDVDDVRRYSRWLGDKRFFERVSMPGKVPHAKLAEAYSASDIFVVSSRSETANVSMLEALACGLPVVATRCGGPESLIDESVGILAEANSPSSLGDAILRMAGVRGSLRRETIRKFVISRYSKDVVGKMMLTAYAAAINNVNTRMQ